MKTFQDNFNALIKAELMRRGDVPEDVAQAYVSEEWQKISPKTRTRLATLKTHIHKDIEEQVNKIWF